MKTITKNIFEFAELSDTAKDTARNWYRECASHDEWWEGIYEDAKRAGLKITSFDLDRGRHAEGEFIRDHAVYCAQHVVAEHGPECETFKTATAFLAQRTILERRSTEEIDRDIKDCDDEFLRSILEGYSILLQREYEYQYSDECVDGTILANEYTFDENGNREG